VDEAKVSADGTLDLIDGALRDYELSSDAMRWTPDRDAARDNGWSRMQGMTPSVVIFDEVAMFTAGMQAAGQALASFAAAISRGFALSVLSPDMAAAHRAHAIYWPRQHVRCSDCHPIAHPRPLVINGAQYRRRQKARKRRR
jgi:hypothetical protein